MIITAGYGGFYPEVFSDVEYIKDPYWSPFDENATNLWLFNVVQDPNEVEDLSSTMPDKVREMLDKLTAYESTALTPCYPDSDPNCDPALHGGAWGPWM